MIDAECYLQGVEERLAADGCEVTREELGVVGYRSHFKALTRAHIFLIAAKAGVVDADALLYFATGGVNLAIGRKGQWGGFQSAVIVLPVLVAESADEEAVAVTQRPHRLNVGGFAVMAQPAIVDLAAGRSHIFRGTRIWGLAFNSLIKKKLAIYLPNPA